jgi:hypothetical protein
MMDEEPFYIFVLNHPETFSEADRLAAFEERVAAGMEWHIQHAPRFEGS